MKTGLVETGLAIQNAPATVKQDKNLGTAYADSLSYDFPWLLGQKGATARHAIDGGQWRRLDRKQLGLPGPLRSMINRRLHHRA